MAKRSYIQSIHNVFLLMIISMTIIFGVVLATNSYQHYLDDSHNIRLMSLQSSQELLRQNVHKITTLAEARLGNIEDEIKADVFYRIQEAVDIAYEIYSGNLASKEPEEIKGLILDVLRAMRFNRGAGYYFIDNYKSRTILLNPPDASVEGESFDAFGEKGTAVMDQFVHLVTTYGDGFHSYMWPKANDQAKLFKKVSFVKRFDPFDWYIGTGLYIDDYVDVIRNEVIKSTKTLYLSDSSYQLLDEGHNSLIGDIQGTSSEIQLYTPGDFREENNRLYYAEVIPALGLTVGASTDLTFINQQIEEEMEQYKGNMVSQLSAIILITLALTIFFFWMIRKSNKRIRNAFASFSETFEGAAVSNQTLPMEEVAFTELEELCRTANIMIEENKVIKDGLEDVIKERTGELLKAQGKLLTQERLAALGQITATVSHELRNPLGAISNALFNIETALGRQDMPMAEKSIKLSERSLERCVVIIDELLYYGRPKELCLEQVALSDLIEEILEESTWPDDIELTLESARCVEVQGDKEMLRRVILNLLINAQQAFVGQDMPSKRIRLATSMIADTAQVIVEDNGPGIGEELHEKIFEPLFSTKNFGVGLGMTIVKDIITKHQGQVELESTQQGGCRFVITLPIHQN